VHPQRTMLGEAAAFRAAVRLDHGPVERRMLREGEAMDTGAAGIMPACCERMTWLR